MSNLVATVQSIRCHDGVSIVTFSLGEQILTMVSLELDDALRVGSKCLLSVNASSVAIGKNLSGMLSYSNQLSAKVVAIENGKLLTRIILNISGNRVESMITVASSERLGLKVGDDVTALIKSTVLSVSEVIA
ncbi:TOBE domain-containing protein [Sulfurovum sp. zt1-1]|uniref:TOBE domain-containing protein n=1 Tax=Sulfurovum zhangzhouensis TaxID=3019067 RepID=A0ABT7QX18_9BACT|nr:TOBE domain-containing protein [Sulfurovum zhangzhouensis]MDM5271383.1 TOBE domain-containing protein [Sulfurovum zhangzhouensis]